MFAKRRNLIAFWAGCACVCLGVVIHLPMFVQLVAGYRAKAGAADAMGTGAMDGMAKASPFALTIDPPMLAGMVLIVAGVLMTAYGLIPRAQSETGPQASAPSAAVHPDAKLSASNWIMMGVLTLALIIDTMKPATLGFVLPGVSKEYGLVRAQAAWLPFVALVGTAVGSMAWGVLCDLYGRRAAILLAAVMFIGTSICGAMPSFGWNLIMCFMMGAAAGGMLPVAYTLLTETMPARSRGWALVLVGGLGSVGGYLAASSAAAVLEPVYSWRILWLLGLPTGVLLILLNRFIPESADFLRSRRQVASNTGAVAAPGPLSLRWMLLLAALTLVGLAWGLVNFGVLLWLPTELIARGQGFAGMGALLSKSALFAAPVIVLVAAAYSKWSGAKTLIATIVVSVLGLCGLLVMDLPAFQSGLGPLPWVVLLIVGINGVLATVLPFAAENSALVIRGRATGWVAGSTKAGGILAQALGLVGIAPSLSVAAIFVAALFVVAAGLLSLNLSWPTVRLAPAT